MNIYQQEQVFKHITATSRITQTVMGGLTSTCPDPANGVFVNGRRYDLADAVRLLKIQITHAKLEHERNGKAIEGAVSFLDALADEAQVAQTE